jgi:predicted MFS family arabinose efflux permease
VLTSAALSAASILTPFFLGYFVSYALRSVNAVIAPELHLGEGQLGFLTSLYFLAFAAAQLPVGHALDRWGPRRVVGGLMLLAAAGVLVFAGGRSLVVLALGRALMGLGVSACLMGALKAVADAFPPERQTSLTAALMAAGLLGALVTTVPLEAALPVLGWRGALFLASGLAALAAVVIWLGAPRGWTARHDSDAGQVLWRSPTFWRFAPQATLFTGGYMAIQGLWVAAWATAVEGRTRAGAAVVLLFLNLGSLCGQLCTSVAAPRLARAGLGREALMTGSLAVALLVEGAVILRLAGGAAPWFLYGFFAAASAQVYGVTASYFPRSLTGRVTTAVNQLAFAGAFLLQWGIGAAVAALGRRTGHAYPIAFGAMWLGQSLAVAWSARGLRRGAANAPSV